LRSRSIAIDAVGGVRRVVDVVVDDDDDDYDDSVIPSSFDTSP
jgi:hypothetical protein